MKNFNKGIITHSDRYKKKQTDFLANTIKIARINKKNNKLTDDTPDNQQPL